MSERRNLPPGVERVETPTGLVRYEVRVEIGNADGTRKQTKRRFTKVKDAVAFYNGVAADRARGVHIAPNTLTVQRAVDDWLLGKTLRPKTKSAYIHALRPLVDALGDRPVQSITKADILRVRNDLRDGKSTSGTWNAPTKLPKLAKKTRGPWKATSINPMLAHARAIWDDLMKQGIVLRNTPALVEALPTEKVEYTTLTAQQVTALIAGTAGDRYGVGWHLAVLGLRRGEIAALRWDDVDYTSGRLRVFLGRTPVAGGSQIGPVKTTASARQLPMPPDLITAFRRTRTRQREDQLRAANRYTDTGFVMVDAHGSPPHPDTITDEWTAALKRLDLPHVRLHDARHSCATLMHARGVPIADIAAWLGHQDASFTQRTYAHSTDAGLSGAAATIGSITTGANKRSRKRSV